MNHISFTALAKLLDKPNNNIYYDSITNVTNSVKYEIVDEKTKNSKTYKSENDLYETEIYNKAVHYLDNGKYVNIDNTLIDFGDYYRNNKNSFFINFPKTLKDKAIELDYQDYLMKIYFDDFVRAINSLNKHENFDIYITGSNSKFLSKDINDEFKDRGSEINVRPLSFSEYYPAYKKDKRFALGDYLRYGGMPGLFEEETDFAKEKYLDNLMRKVYIDDIKKNIHTNLVEELSATVDALCSVTGSLTNPLNMANYLISEKHIKVDDETISRFFDGITDAFLFDKVKRYNIKGKEYLNTPSKFYCQDIGLRNVRINFREPNQGFLIENVVYNELVTRGYRVDVGFLEQKKKNKDGKYVYVQSEVDFIARISSKEYYIQIMDEIPEEKHLNNEYDAILKVPGSFKKIMVINKPIMYYTNEMGILVISLEDFLLNDKSLDL